jgi:hypothetical protein
LVGVTNFKLYGTDPKSSFFTLTDFRYRDRVDSIIAMELPKAPGYEDLIREYNDIKHAPRLLRWMFLFKANSMEEV